MIPETSLTCAEGVSPGLQQAINIYRSSPLSVANFFGLGAVLILTLLASQKLVLRLHAQ